MPKGPATHWSGQPSGSCYEVPATCYCSAGSPDRPHLRGKRVQSPPQIRVTIAGVLPDALVRARRHAVQIRDVRLQARLAVSDGRSEELIFRLAKRGGDV